MELLGLLLSDADNLNINTTDQSQLNQTWVCNLTDTEVAVSSLWYFEMKPNIASWSSPYNYTQDEWPSKTFQVRGDVASASATSNSTAFYTAASSATPTSPKPSKTPTATSSAIHGGLNTAAKAGIGTGAGAAAIIIVILGLFLFRQRRSGHQAELKYDYPPLKSTANPALAPNPSELPDPLTVNNHGAELASHHGYGLPPVELGVTTVGLGSTGGQNGYAAAGK
jgi:hypothetical protein